MKKTPENLIKQEIKGWLSCYGWFHFPLLQGLGSYPGLPDLVAIKDGVILFIECKAPGGRQTAVQKRFQENIEANGGHYILAQGYEDVERIILQLPGKEEK